ncbi:MAG TPA: amidase [Amycolatopsis sp.]|nr:amidase [Amycolatopsis sp.]
MSDELCELTATEQSSLVQKREVSAVELLEAHLRRIDRLNPVLNAIVTRDDEGARASAREADRMLAAGDPVGPLHGLPVAHKDTHETAGMRTTWGSPLRRDYVPRDDELIIARLRTAGAIRVGKTNVPEWGAGSHTFNPVFGPTRNPWDTSRSAGGSSGGAAAALATGMVALAEGSDMGGSLRNPAAFCNVVGFRPTPGRVPTVPAALPWQTLVVQGPMGRTVSDVALMLSAIAGPDPRAPLSRLDPEPACHSRDGFRGLRVAWAPDLGGRIPVDRTITEVLAPAADLVEELGGVLVDACPDLSGADETFDVLRAWQQAVLLGDLVREHPEQVKETVRWNVERGFRLTGEDIGRAEVAHGRLHRQVLAFFDEVDVLLAPTTQVLPFDVDLEYPAEVDGRPMSTYLEWMRSCSLISATGCPAVSVPGGFTAEGLPVGLQIVGAPHADLQVLGIAQVWEEKTGHHTRRPSCLSDDDFLTC